MSRGGGGCGEEGGRKVESKGKEGGGIDVEKGGVRGRGGVSIKIFSLN
jgi:hypothetical protein